MPGVLKYWNGSSWVEVDVPGPVGPTGPTGPTGATGATGPTGSAELKLISSLTLATATTTFSAIPATYKNLILTLNDVIVSAASVGLGIQLNNDTGGNYSGTTSYSESGDSSTTRAWSSTGSASSFFLTANNMRGTAGTGGGDRQNQFIVEMPNYSQAVAYKNINSYGVYFQNVAGNYASSVSHGSWRNTAAITEIDINVSTGNFDSGTAYLYGY